MKKMIELEYKWKAYKYKVIVYYIFIIVLITFILFLGFFIKFQYERYSSGNKIIKNSVQIVKSKEQNTMNNNINAIKDSEQSLISTKTSFNAPININLTCRQVIADRLTVRSQSNFKSKPLGYYTENSIFCAKDDIVNGLLQTTNGWVSANDAYSQIVEVNMFTDFGFHKYQNINQNSGSKVIVKAPIEEIKVLENKKPAAQYANATLTNTNDIQNSKDKNVLNEAHVVTKPSKSVINITSEKITKEKEIELKESNFKHTKNYDAAIEIAEYYFKNKNYNNSIKWALNASNVDSKSEQKTKSWILYAKSLYAMGKKEQAIEVLNKYISNTNSKDAIEVLNNMKQGII